MGKKPLYREIADTIMQQVRNGELKPGDALPTEAELCTHYQVSRVTIRQALKLLTEQDIVESIQGSGTYIKEERVNYDIYQLTSFYEKLTDRNVETHSDVLVFSVLKASEEIASFLSLPVDTRIYYVKRVRYIKQKPVALEETWMPLVLFPDLSYEVMQQSKYHYIEQVKKMVIDRSEQEIIPVMPDAEVADALGIDMHQPILEKVSVGYLSDGTIFEYSRNFFKSNDYKFTLVAKRRR